MQNFSISPTQMVATFVNHKNLILNLVKRDIIGRYRGSALGILWSFFNPLLMLAIYTFVFSIIFNARWGASASNSKTEFALVLFAGLMVFTLFAECISKSPGLIVSNTNYVKKVVFPLEILSLVALGSAFFHFLISLFVWVLAYFILFGMPPVTAFYLPIILLPLIFFTMGVTWFLSSLGVYIRDISQFIGVLVTTLMFLSPIFYPITAIPVEYQGYILLNPLTYIIEQTRDVLIWGKDINWEAWMGYFGASLIVSWLGFAWFQKTRKGFSDVL